MLRMTVSFALADPIMKHLGAIRHWLAAAYCGGGNFDGSAQREESECLPDIVCARLDL